MPSGAPGIGGLNGTPTNSVDVCGANNGPSSEKSTIVSVSATPTRVMPWRHAAATGRIAADRRDPSAGAARGRSAGRIALIAPAPRSGASA